MSDREQHVWFHLCWAFQPRCLVDGGPWLTSNSPKHWFFCMTVFPFPFHVPSFIWQCMCHLVNLTTLTDSGEIIQQSISFITNAAAMLLDYGTNAKPKKRYAMIQWTFYPELVTLIDVLLSNNDIKMIVCITCHWNTVIPPVGHPSLPRTSTPT